MSDNVTRSIAPSTASCSTSSTISTSLSNIQHDDSNSSPSAGNSCVSKQVLDRKKFVDDNMDLPPSPSYGVVRTQEQNSNKSSSSNSNISDTISEVTSSKDTVGKDLISWLEMHGAETKKLMLKQYAPEVRGVHSRKILVPGERILVIPKACLITVEMGQKTEIGQKLLALNYDFIAPKHIYLMMFLLTDMEQVK
jgi:hypothetical protein